MNLFSQPYAMTCLPRLGLVVVHAGIESHRGTLRVESEAGRGTTFTVSLPL